MVTLFDRVNGRSFQVATEQQANQLLRQLPDQFRRVATSTPAPRPTQSAPNRMVLTPSPRPTPQSNRLPAPTFVGFPAPPPVPRPTPQPVPPLTLDDVLPSNPRNVQGSSRDRFGPFLPGASDFLKHAGRGFGMIREDLQRAFDVEIFPGFNLFRGFSPRPQPRLGDFIDEYLSDPSSQLDRFNDRGTFSGDLGINAFVPGDILGPNVIPTPLLDPSSGFNIDIDALGRPIPQFRHFFPTNPRIPYAGPTLGLF